jgi:hypothetical protein
MRREKRKDIAVELYFDSTVEPFANPPFMMNEVRDMLGRLASLGVEVRIVDTAGWSRKMLMERYREVVSRRGTAEEIFGPRGKRGWFFGREVPALIVRRTNGTTEVYPCIVKGRLITPSDLLRKLLGAGGE